MLRKNTSRSAAPRRPKQRSKQNKKCETDLGSGLCCGPRLAACSFGKAAELVPGVGMVSTTCERGQWQHLHFEINTSQCSVQSVIHDRSRQTQTASSRGTRADHTRCRVISKTSGGRAKAVLISYKNKTLFFIWIPVSFSLFIVHQLQVAKLNMMYNDSWWLGIINACKVKKVDI